MKRIVLLFALLCASLLASAQNFALGDTREQVRHSFGTSPALYSLPFDRIFPFDQEAFVASAGQYHDVWDVTSTSNTFRARFKFTPDASASRLHPVDRLQSVTITPDKNQAASEMLQGIDPLRKLCVDGCFVTALRVGSYLSVLTCAKPSTVLKSVAQGSYGGWNIDHESGTYTICAVAEYGDHPELDRTKLRNVAFNHLYPSYIRVTGEHIETMHKVGETWPLGTWLPK